MTRRSVVIVGAGISGLCAAYELTGGVDGPTLDGPRIELLEASERLGGTLATTTFAGRTVDCGPDGFLGRRPEAVQLVRDLNLEARLDPIATSGASLYANGQLGALPEGLVLGVPTSEASLRSLTGLPRSGRWAAWRDEHLPRRYEPSADPTIGEILRAKLGSTLTYQVVEPLIGGIQAGRVDQLSAASVFPALLAAARAGGSLMHQLAATVAKQSATPDSRPVFYSLDAGVGSLVEALTTVLRERGVVIRTGTPVTKLRRSPSSDYPWEVDTSTTCTPAHEVILATPPAITGRLATAIHPDLARLVTMPTASAAMITLQVPRNAAIERVHGTGILVPLETPFGSDTFLTTAVTFLDRKWAHLASASDHLVRLHVGRIDDERWSSFSDDDLIGRVVAELAVLLGAPVTVIDALVQRWPLGLPQYLVGHQPLVAKARTAAAEVGLTLCGNAYDGVGIPACIGLGRAVGREVLLRLTPH